MLTGIASATARAAGELDDALVARYTGFAGWLRANDFRVTSERRGRFDGGRATHGPTR